MLNLIMTTRNIVSNESQRFLDSLTNLSDDIKQNILLVIVNQGEKMQAEPDINYKEVCIEKCSLSHARNVGLQYIEESGIVGFPDDDCWYNQTVLPFVLENIVDNDFICVGVFDPYKNIPYGRNREMNQIATITEENVLVLPISVGIFYKYNSIGEIPQFDEKFGVGTEWGSGEETDFLLQLMHNGKKGVYNSFDCVYHEAERNKDFDVNVTYKYSLGFAAMVIKSYLTRNQTEVYKRLKKLMLRTRLAILYYLFSKKKRSVYVARLKGLNKGLKEGRRYYK